MVSEREIQHAREYDLRELIEALGIPFKRESTHIKICCPFHEERQPSLAIYPDGKWYCYGCAEHGDAINFVMRVLMVDFGAAVKMINKKTNR